MSPNIFLSSNAKLTAKEVFAIRGFLAYPVNPFSPGKTGLLRFQ